MGTLGAHYHTSGTSSMAATTGASRLAMMQARLQQQLMHEKESRLLQMAARQEVEREGTIQRVTKSSASTLSSSLSSLSSLNSSMGGQGRVRKLFEERRTNGYGHSPVGRDKSYPLEPMRGGGRPPVKPIKGVVKQQRGVSVDRGRTNYDAESMRRTRSHAGLQNNNANSFNNNYEPRSPARALRPPQSKSLSHHKSTSSLLDANQNYNGRGSSSSSGVYSRGPSRDPSPAPSPSPSNHNRFGFRGPPSRGPSPSPHPVAGSPARGPAASIHRRTSLNTRYSEDRIDAPRNPPSQPRQPPVPPPRQQPRQPPRQPPRQQERPTRPPRRQPSPSPADDDDDSAFLNPRPPPRSQSKPSSTKGVPPITRVAPQPVKKHNQKPNPPPKPKAAPAPAQRPSKPPPGLASCKICNRHFNPDRLEKHETICAQTAAKAKKRKPFDPVKMRTKGTESEQFVRKGMHLKPAPKPKKKDWRKQHQDFIATIRAAKTGTEAPPTDNSDYVECPHCGRKFNEQAADRHIPKCSSIKSNKPMGNRRR